MVQSQRTPPHWTSDRTQHRNVMGISPLASMKALLGKTEHIRADSKCLQISNKNSTQCIADWAPKLETLSEDVKGGSVKDEMVSCTQDMPPCSTHPYCKHSIFTET